MDHDKSCVVCLFVVKKNISEPYVCEKEENKETGYWQVLFQLDTSCQQSFERREAQLRNCLYNIGL